MLIVPVLCISAGACGFGAFVSRITVVGSRATNLACCIVPSLIWRQLCDSDSALESFVLQNQKKSYFSSCVGDVKE